MTDFRIPVLNDFLPEERTSAVKLLLQICHSQQEQLKLQEERIQQLLEQVQLQSEQITLQAEQIQRLKDEIAILKGEKGRPQIKPSNLNKNNTDVDSSGDSNNPHKRGKLKRKKTRGLKIHEQKIINPDNIPEDAEFKGYKDYIVQDIEIKLKNIKYRRARYKTKDGQYIIGQLPGCVAESHFGSTLRSYILSQYYQQHVPQKLILEQLWEFEVRISSGQLNHIITEEHEVFHAEKEEVLREGLEVSSYINVDDTGARHKGKNGYCTHIGNEFFAYFSSTPSKSRVNFLELLRVGCTDYTVDETARLYMQQQKLPNEQLALLSENIVIPNKGAWEKHLESVGITTERHKRVAIEGALVGTLVNGGIRAELVIMSDDAGQFNIAGFLNALCWVHAERNINKIIPFTDANREAQEKMREQIWSFYRQLKEYKITPTEPKKLDLNQQFDEIFTQKTCFQSLNIALGRIYDNKNELLLVLERPEIPLHNNLSENDIRDYVKKRKISPTTRSDVGQQARDTFLSLKKTCKKLGLSFSQYLQDRLEAINLVPPLKLMIRAAAQAP